MKPLLLFAALCITLSLTQCKDDDNSGSCADNPEDLPWLQQKISFFETTQSDMSVFQLKYMSSTVFMMVLCCPSCEVVPVFYDCAGRELTNINYSLLQDQTLIWSLPNSACG